MQRNTDSSTPVSPSSATSDVAVTSSGAFPAIDPQSSPTSDAAVSLPERKLRGTKPKNLNDDIQRSLPPGIELHRAICYQMPLLKNSFSLTILKLNVPNHLEEKLAEWRHAIEDRHPSTTILIHRVEVDQSLQNNLLNNFRESPCIKGDALPTLEAMLSKLCGEEPEPSRSSRTSRPPREDLTSVPFIAPDRPETIDQEDLIYGEKKADGSLILRTAFIDITDEITPFSGADKYALRVGTTLYGKHRAIPAVGSALFGGAASFKVGERRPAWVIECKVAPHNEASEFFKVRRAWVVNHANLDPSRPFDVESNKEIAKNLSALAEITRVLENRRLRRSAFIRIDGEGATTRIVSETMIHSKRLLARYLSTWSPTGAIYRVHQRPSDTVVADCVQELQLLKIPASIEDFKSPLSFAGILRSLQERPSPQAAALSNKIIDTFLLRTQYSPKNVGHFGLGLREYLEIKPRDATGITNQFQLDSIFTNGTPIPEAELLRRAESLNNKRWSRDERHYKLRFLEMLTERLQQVGSFFLAEVAKVNNDLLLCQVESFSKWGVVRKPADLTVQPGEILALTLEGFNINEMRFEFSVTGR